LSEPRIVFIGGTGRSGTNIMKEILSLHPEVGSHPFEYRFIIDPDGIIDFYNSVTSSWSPYLVDNKLKRLENFLKLLSKKGSKKRYKDYELSKYFSNYDEAVDELMDSLVDFKYEAYYYGLEKKREMYFMNKTKDQLKEILRNFIFTLINNYLKEVSKKVYVEDNTHNILFADKIFDLIPSAKFIHMKRNYLDVIASLSHQTWAPKDIIKSAHYYFSIISNSNKVLSLIPSSSYLEVDLYELVDNRARVLDEVCEFINIKPCEEFYSIDLSKHNKGRWKKDITKLQYDEIKRILDYYL